MRSLVRLTVLAKPVAQPTPTSDTTTYRAHMGRPAAKAAGAAEAATGNRICGGANNERHVVFSRQHSAAPAAHVPTR